MNQMLKNPDVKNANKSKNRLTPVKLESKKQEKNYWPRRRDRAGKAPTSDAEKPRPTYLTLRKNLFKKYLLDS